MLLIIGTNIFPYFAIGKKSGKEYSRRMTEMTIEQGFALFIKALSGNNFDNV
jgi:hypothetical protein